ncbi:MAG: RluA family pseudouridine synthase [Candidatus Puniceispirillaceae bacterium]
MTESADKTPVPWRIETVPPDEDNSRLDRFLRRLVPGLAQGSIERMLRNGLIRLDGAKAKANSRIAAGQSVRLPPDLQPAPDSPTLESSDTETSVPGKTVLGTSGMSAPNIIADANLRRKFDDMVLAEGRGWIAINKPSGLAVQGGTSIATHVDGMLQALASHTNGRLRLVHRIDKDTSGVLLLAKTLESARALTEAFHRHKIEKTYLAIVMGMPAESGKIRAPLKKLAGKFGEKMVVDDDGQDATTLYRRIDHAGRKLSLMALRPVSGRTHQLRVHMQHINTPICGDGKYGGDAAHPGDMVARRLHLHAWQVKLADGKVITAPLSPHFAASMEQLGLTPPPPGWRFQDQ